MKLRNHSIFLALALVAAGCSESENIVENPNATPGEEVQFGSSLAEDAVTRTVYGAPSTDAYPVYWVQDDKVIVTSPQCMSGYNNREYSINVDSETQDYATGSLQKTTDTGIRWGEDGGSANFYSVYPSKNASAADETLTKFALTMPSTQNITLQMDDDNKYTNVYANADMDACFMWAKKDGVASGSTVNLQYTPMSTALRFTLQGPASDSDDPVTVTSVVITATEGIAGRFNVELKDASTSSFPTVSDVDASSNSVTLVALSDNGTYLTLANGEAAELNAFIIPQEYTSIVGWTITVKTASGNTFTRTILSSDLEKNNSLAAGKVHNLGTLPCLSEGDWNLYDWMTNLHPKTYLSEVSIPGSWNSLNPNFQSNTSISDQYAKGCRAFHLDTRWKRTRLLNNSYELGVCDNGKTVNYINGKVIAYSASSPTFTSALKSITDCVKSDEYMVVLCTFAQDSYAYNGSDGWINAVSEACANNDKVIDASEINEETTKDKVEGKVIVIVCTDDSSLKLPTDSKCMITYLPNTIENEEDFKDASHKSLENVNGSSNLTLYATQAQITSNKESEGIDTNERGYAPYIQQRKDVAQNILDWSSSNYDSKESQTEKYGHNQWMYLGLGGYLVSNTAASAVTDGTATIANEFNPWIKRKIDDMATNKHFFPVGIVLMNHVCETNGAAAANAIVQLNTKYEMAKASSSTTTTTSSVKAHTQSSYKNGGNAISH